MPNQIVKQYFFPPYTTDPLISKLCIYNIIEFLYGYGRTNLMTKLKPEIHGKYKIIRLYINTKTTKHSMDLPPDETDLQICI